MFVVEAVHDGGADQKVEKLVAHELLAQADEWIAGIAFMGNLPIGGYHGQQAIEVTKHCIFVEVVIDSHVEVAQERMIKDIIINRTERKRCGEVASTATASYLSVLRGEIQSPQVSLAITRGRRPPPTDSRRTLRPLCSRWLRRWGLLGCCARRRLLELADRRLL